MQIDRSKPILSLNIVAARRALGLTAERFSELADVPYPTIRDIEAGKSSGRKGTIAKIAAALNVPEWCLGVPGYFEKVDGSPKSETNTASSSPERSARLKGLIESVERLSESDLDLVITLVGRLRAE